MTVAWLTGKGTLFPEMLWKNEQGRAAARP
jgi:hypothetical protein